MDAPKQGAGTYFDGISGAAHLVTVTLEDAALVIAGSDGTGLARWDYGALERLPAPDHRVRLGLAGSPSTARLEIRDPAFAEAVKDRIGMRTLQVETAERRRRHRVVEWSIAGVAALMLIGVVGIPALAELLVPFIPYTADMAMGASADQAEKGDFKEPGPVLCGDEGNQERAGKAVFLRLVSRMESAANLPIPLHVSVVRTRVINASAGGGYVTVNMGLINDARTPDELGATIGHELGHVAHRDMLRNFLHQAGLSFLFGAVLGDVTGSSGITYAAFKVLGNRNSRGVEAQADAYGADLMRKLGANAHADADFFERMMKNARPSRRMLLFLDHPADADRIAAIRREPNSANPKPLLSDEEWQTLKQVCSRK